MKIALLGYGKMGKEIEQIALKRKHTIIARVDMDNASTFSIAELSKADVAIEFSTPETAVKNIYKCFEAKVPVVVGTTGWLKKFNTVKADCKKKKQGLFYSSNYSIGVNIFFKLNTHLAKIMNAYKDYDVSIEEIHHIHKLDSPSGTAITLANQILSEIKRKKKWINNAPEDMNQLSILSKRENEVPGTHVVTYNSAIDTIAITHRAHSRKGFAMGAVLAAEFMKKRKGVYSMDDLLKIV
jgi:4-hydroxy-tetrahydrodipicolinate reductase